MWINRGFLLDALRTDPGHFHGASALARFALRSNVIFKLYQVVGKDKLADLATYIFKKKIRFLSTR
jgi:hypothetical protein